MTQTALNLVTRELVPEAPTHGRHREVLRHALPAADRADRLRHHRADGRGLLRADIGTSTHSATGASTWHPQATDVFHVTCDNMFEGDLSADALGITACLYAYSHLSFSATGGSPGCAPVIITGCGST